MLKFSISWNLKLSFKKKIFLIIKTRIFSIFYHIFQLKQMIDILYNKFTKRSLDVRSLTAGTPSVNLSEARQEVTVKQGIEQEDAKKICRRDGAVSKRPRRLG